MAGESANHHIDVWNSSPTGVIFVENESNILVYYRALSKVVFVASSSKLSLVGAWLPLVCPYGFVWTGCRELPALCVIAITLKAKPEPTDSCEELGYRNLLVHVSPFAVCGLIPRRS